MDTVVYVVEAGSAQEALDRHLGAEDMDENFVEVEDRWVYDERGRVCSVEE